LVLQLVITALKQRAITLTARRIGSLLEIWLY